MGTKFNHSWELFKASIAVTRRNRKLLWFPALSTFLTVLIALFFLAPVVLPAVLHPTGYHLNQKEHWMALRDYYLDYNAITAEPKKLHPKPAAPQILRQIFTGHAADDTLDPAAVAHASTHGFLASRSGWLYWLMLTPVGWIYWFVVYFGLMFVAIFLNVAFYSEIISALNGRGVSIRRGLSVARSRWPSILAWTLLAGAVGWIIRSIERRLPFVARLVTGFIGLAWSVAAVFAIPVIIQEQPLRNPMKILKQSVLTLKRTWGEGLIGYLGFSAGNGIIFMCSLVPLLLAALIAFGLKSIWFIAVAGMIWVIGLLFMAYVVSVASQVYRCALYIYAAEGVVPAPYNQDLLDMAWKVKKS